MKYISGTKDFLLQESVVVLGNFDGIHKGHRLLINHAKDQAISRGLKSILFTFEPHPSFVLAGKKPVDLIYLNKEKENLLKEEVDIFVEYPFDIKTAQMESEYFIKTIIKKQLNAKAVIVGEDYHFGAGRKGDITLLCKLSKKLDYDVIVMPKLRYKNKIISSTWIREEIKLANIELANKLLGHLFSISGIVESGKKLGRTIGFPTINIKPEKNKLLPPDGVYISVVVVNNIEYNSITNIGTKPTVNGKDIVIETFILKYNNLLYNEYITIKLKKHLREERKFNSISELKKQIEKDVQELKKQLKNKNN